MNVEKLFLFKDLTGREYTSRLSAEDLLNLENEECYSDILLHEFSEEADVGDEWENRTMKFIRIQ